MRRSLLAALLAATLAASACGDDSGSGAPVTSAAAPGGSTGEGPAGVPTALQFTAPLVGGGEVDFSRFAGQTVLLWFWAPT